MLHKENAEFAGLSCFGNLLFCSVCISIVIDEGKKNTCFLFTWVAKVHGMKSTKYAELLGESRFDVYITKIRREVLVALPNLQNVAEFSSFIPVPWKRCLSSLRPILLAPALSAIPSCSLMACSHSGEFSLFWLLPISIWTCSSICQLKK